MELIEIVRDTLIGWARQHPGIATLIVFTLLWAVKQPALKLLDDAGKLITNNTGPVVATLKSAGNSWTARADEFEKTYRQVHKHGVAGTLVSSLLFVGFVVGLATLNFYLLLRPLEEILGQGSLAGIPLAVIGAGAILALEFVVGAVALSAVGASRMLKLTSESKPVNWPWAIVFGVFLLALAVVEASLAVFREQLIELASETLVGGAASNAEANATGRIGLFAQATLGFILPFAIAAAVLPVESLFGMIEIVVRRIGAFFALVVRVPLAFLSNLTERGVAILSGIYDIITKPAEIVFSGMATVINRVFPDFFKAK